MTFQVALGCVISKSFAGQSGKRFHTTPDPSQAAERKKKNHTQKPVGQLGSERMRAYTQTHTQKPSSMSIQRPLEVGIQSNPPVCPTLEPVLVIGNNCRF